MMAAMAMKKARNIGMEMIPRTKAATAILFPESSVIAVASLRQSNTLRSLSCGHRRFWLHRREGSHLLIFIAGFAQLVGLFGSSLASSGAPGNADLAALLIDLEEDKAARAVIWSLLAEMERK
jgi:hypothetical protein